MFNLTSQEQKIILFIIGIVLAVTGLYWVVFNKSKPAISAQVGSVPIKNSNQQLISVDTSSTVIVHVSGAVKKPGVFPLSRGSRIYQAILAAGDTTGNADVSEVNYAQVLQDGEKIIIPSQVTKETTNSVPAGVMIQTLSIPITPSPIVPNQVSRAPGRININSAGVQELDQLPGIGPKLAIKIIDYRQRYGRFQKVEDITKVNGIGLGKFRDIRDKITVY